MTTYQLAALSLRFEQHCDECMECDCVVEQGCHGAPELVEISFTHTIKPHLCPVGRNLLLEIFD